MFETPILFLIFNRPDITQKVFDVIKIIQPKYFFIAADGPRNQNENDLVKCAQTRAIIDQIDWSCEIKTLFRKENLGCKAAVSSAIDWFFDQVDRGIILEDDCLPDLSFFDFCQQMLLKYEHDSRIMHITGTNVLFKDFDVKDSYYFSKYANMWGWASWKRAWKLYDVDLKLWPEFERRKGLNYIFNDPIEVAYFQEIIDLVYKNELNTWDIQWFFCNFIHSSLVITPYKNLISNIGFRDDATHTHSVNICANIPLEKIGVNTHPTYFVHNKEADQIAFNTWFYGYQIRKQKTLWYKAYFFFYRIYRKLKKILSNRTTMGS